MRAKYGERFLGLFKFDVLYCYRRKDFHFSGINRTYSLYDNIFFLLYLPLLHVHLLCHYPSPKYCIFFIKLCENTSQMERSLTELKITKSSSMATLSGRETKISWPFLQYLIGFLKVFTINLKFQP